VIDFECYDTTLRHFFRTADAAEASAIDNGAAGPGWVRTGLNFNVYPAGTGPGFSAQSMDNFQPVAITSKFNRARPGASPNGPIQRCRDRI
jgi:hypothetical protein